LGKNLFKFWGRIFKLGIISFLMKNVRVRLRYGPCDPEYRLHGLEDKDNTCLLEAISVGELEKSIKDATSLEREGLCDFYQVRFRGTRFEICGKQRDTIVSVLVDHLKNRDVNLVFCGEARDGYIQAK
jgi:hypothetical protein